MANELSLSLRQRKIAADLTRTICPPIKPFDRAGQDLEVVDQLEIWLNALDAIYARGVILMLELFNLGAITWRFKFKQFTSLNDDDKFLYLDGWERSRLYFKRSLLMALKLCLMQFYYAQDSVCEAIGYNPECDVVVKFDY